MTFKIRLLQTKEQRNVANARLIHFQKHTLNLTNELHQSTRCNLWNMTVCSRGCTVETEQETPCSQRFLLKPKVTELKENFERSPFTSLQGATSDCRSQPVNPGWQRGMRGREWAGSDGESSPCPNKAERGLANHVESPGPDACFSHGAEPSHFTVGAQGPFPRISFDKHLGLWQLVWRRAWASHLRFIQST